MKSSKAGLWIAAAVFLAIACHGIFWLGTARAIEQRLPDLYSEAEKLGIRIEGPPPAVRGYPRAPSVVFSGRLIAGDSVVEIPRAAVSGMPFPGGRMTVDFPGGIALRGQVDPEIWSLGSLLVRFAVPETLPEDFTAEGLRPWAETGGRLELTEIALTKRSLAASGSGSIGLDRDLQPAGQLGIKMTGDFIDFLSFLKSRNVIGTKEAVIGGAVLTALSRPDPETGAASVGASFTLQNRTLLFESLKLAEMPEAVWPWRHPPAARELPLPAPP